MLDLTKTNHRSIQTIRQVHTMAFIQVPFTNLRQHRIGRLSVNNKKRRIRIQNKFAILWTNKGPEQQHKKKRRFNYIVILCMKTVDIFGFVFFSEEENDKDYYLNHSITIFSNLLIFSLYSTAKKTHRQLYVSYRLALN